MSEINIVKERSFMGGIIIRFVKGMLIASVLSLLIFVLLSVIVLFVDFPDNYTTLMIILTTIISLFISGFFSAKTAGSGGWINGVAIGILYAIVLLIVGSILTGEFLISTKWALNLLIASLSGAVGGIVGVNFRK